MPAFLKVPAVLGKLTYPLRTKCYGKMSKKSTTTQPAERTPEYELGNKNRPLIEATFYDLGRSQKQTNL